MQIGSRFTEYGLTGGFFWICQILFLAYSGQGKTLLSHLSTVQQLQIPPWISQIGATAISALAIIAVFVTGLLLDLFAVYYRAMEMRAFHKHLVRNREWLGRLIADHKGYCEADYQEFERKYAKGSLPERLVFWKRYVAAVKRTWSARSYERLWSFFASFVLVESGSSQLSLMMDQYHLWRTGRAVSTALVIVFFEIQSLIWSRGSEIPFLVGFVLPLAMTALAMVITLGTYSRLCFTLFALVYVTQDKAQRDKKI